MAKFKKKKSNGDVSMNTSALPDIVFMLLFFFMVSTKMKDKEMKVKTIQIMKIFLNFKMFFKKFSEFLSLLEKFSKINEANDIQLLKDYLANFKKFNSSNFEFLKESISVNEFDYLNKIIICKIVDVKNTTCVISYFIM